MRRPAVVLGVLCAVVLTAYWPSFTGWLQYENSHWISEILTPITLRPTWDLAHWSLSLDAALVGESPFLYHLTNIGIHCVNGVLVYLLAHRLFVDTALTAGRDRLFGLGLVTHAHLEAMAVSITRRWKTPALIAAAVFLLHPIQTEAVAYLTGRWELVSTMLVLIACLAPWPVAVVAAVCAMTTKTSAIVVLPLLFLVRESSPWSILAAIPCGVVMAGAIWKDAFGLVPYLMQSPYGPLEYAARQAVAFWRMLALVVVPWGQTIDHDWAHVPMWVIPIALLTLISVPLQLHRIRKAQPILWLAACWILIAIAPRFFVRLPEFLFEKQMYVPMVGVSLLVGSWWAD